MMRLVILCFVGLLAPLAPLTTAHAQNAAPAGGPVSPDTAAKIPDTLMFTIDEFNEIQSHGTGREGEAGSGGGSGGAQAIESASLYLSTILYFSPTDWTIWVNGVPISPDQEFQSFKVTEITPSYVELLVPLSAQGMRPVRLGPNQTFIAKSGVIVEGHAR